MAAARSLDKLELLAREIGGDRIAAAPMDVTDQAERTSALRFAHQRFGPIDVLVNNAGWASFSSIVHTPREHVERMIRLNVMGPDRPDPGRPPRDDRAA